MPIVPVTESKHATVSNAEVPGPSDISSESHDGTIQKWSRQEVLQLLHLYRKNEETFSEENVKWNLKIWNKKYIKTVDHNNKSGNDVKTCSSFDELSAIFACNPSVEPVAVCSNRSGYKKANNKEEFLES